MRNTFLCIAAALCISPAFAGDKSFATTKDGAGYEATLRRVGIPQSGGMVWPVVASRKVPAPVATLALAKSKQ